MCMACRLQVVARANLFSSPAGLAAAVTAGLLNQRKGAMETDYYTITDTVSGGASETPLDTF